MPIKRTNLPSNCGNGRGETQNYVGLTANTFKERYSGHLTNFNNEHSKGTTLSTYIWKLKNESKIYNITWKILKHAKPFSPINGQCALCTAEKKFIIFKPELSSLNSRNELGAHCRHKEMKLLFKKPRLKGKSQISIQYRSQSISNHVQLFHPWSDDCLA